MMTVLCTILEDTGFFYGCIFRELPKEGILTYPVPLAPFRNLKASLLNRPLLWSGNRHFRLANAGMRTIGVKAIAAALCANATLEILDLSGNDFVGKANESIGESAEELLSFGLKARSKLRCFPEEATKNVCRVLKRGSC